MPSPTVDPNRVILTGENPFIRLSESDDGPATSEANFWAPTRQNAPSLARGCSDSPSY